MWFIHKESITLQLTGFHIKMRFWSYVERLGKAVYQSVHRSVSLFSVLTGTCNEVANHGDKLQGFLLPDGSGAWHTSAPPEAFAYEYSHPVCANVKYNLLRAVSFYLYYSGKKETSYTNWSNYVCSFAFVSLFCFILLFAFFT